MSIFSIKDKTIIITGSSKGIGKYLADNLVEYGAKVYGISRKKITNTKFSNIVCDINDYNKIRKEIKKIFSKEKKICVLINNAGITKPSKNLTNNLKDFDEVINTITRAPLFIANECYKYMSKNGGGGGRNY